MDLDEKKLAGFIDHTLLSATATSGTNKETLRRGEQVWFLFGCVNGRWVGFVLMFYTAAG